MNGFGKWTFGNGTGEFPLPTDGSSTVQSLTAEVTEIVWTVSAPACTDSVATAYIYRQPDSFCSCQLTSTGSGTFLSSCDPPLPIVLTAPPGETIVIVLPANFTLESLNVTEGVTVVVSGTLNVEGGITVTSQGTLEVTGTATVSGDVTLTEGSSLAVSGTTTFEGELSIESGATMYVSGTATVQGNIGVSSSATLSINGTATMQVTGSMNATGGTLAVSGEGSIIVSGDLDASGANITVSGSGTISVDSITFDSSTTVTSVINGEQQQRRQRIPGNGAIHVNGDASLGGSLQFVVGSGAVGGGVLYSVACPYCYRVIAVTKLD